MDGFLTGFFIGMGATILGIVLFIIFLAASESPNEAAETIVVSEEIKGYIMSLVTKAKPGTDISTLKISASKTKYMNITVFEISVLEKDNIENDTYKQLMSITFNR